MSIYNLKQIETPRLLIRPVEIGDEIALNQAINRSLPLLQRWMPWAKDPSLKTTRAFVEKGVAGWQSGEVCDFPMVVIHKADNKIIAASGFNEKSDLSKPFFEIGYWIDSEYSGQGLVAECVNALTKYALDALSAIHVQIITQVGNAKSEAVAERLGFKVDATLKDYCIDAVSGQQSDSILFVSCDKSLLPPLDVSWENK